MDSKGHGNAAVKKTTLGGIVGLSLSRGGWFKKVTLRRSFEAEWVRKGIHFLNRCPHEAQKVDAKNTNKKTL